MVREKIRPCAMRGRNPDNPSDRRRGIELEQRIEVKNIPISNCITTVEKDTLFLGKVKRMDKGILKIPKEEFYEDDEERWGHGDEPEEIEEEEVKEDATVYDYLLETKDGDLYGIFKLSPRECGRLMGVKDSDIDKMLAVNSNSQCYKQYGNSIVVPVLCAIFSQLNIKGVTPWNKMSAEEKRKICEVVSV